MAPQQTLMPVEEPQALAKPEPARDEMIALIERLATNKDVDVEKLSKILDLQERVLDRQAKAAFDAAFSEMQPKIPTIAEKGKTDKGTYARLEDIVEVVRPILKDYGFSLSFRTEWPDKKTVKVIGILSHREGHSRESEFMSEADQSGSKNAIQALGSAVSYGRRYTTKDLLNIASREEDDDGENVSRAGKPDVEPPKGFEDWWTDLAAVAENGTAALTSAWNTSKPEFRNHLMQTNKRGWVSLKEKAGKVRA